MEHQHPADNLRRIKIEIEAALSEALRPAGSVTISAVSKKQPVERVVAALDAGHRVFAENRVQEAAQKWPALCDQYDRVELRFIGPLQSNKVREAVGLFDAIESIDRSKLATKIADEQARQGRSLDLFVQVNTGEEAQKAGVLPQEVDQFIAFCRAECGLSIKGLMCIPPAEDMPAPHFAFLKSLAARNEIECLSMGMSADYLTAAQLGADYVRIGSGIFGPRAG